MDGPGAKVLKRGRRKPARRGETLIRIVLIRHGKPDVGRSRWLTHGKFKDYIETYEQAGLDPDSPPPPGLAGRSHAPGAPGLFVGPAAGPGKRRGVGAACRVVAEFAVHGGAAQVAEAAADAIEAAGVGGHRAAGVARGASRRHRGLSRRAASGRRRRATCCRRRRAKTVSPFWSRTAISMRWSGGALRKHGWRKQEGGIARSSGTLWSTSAR